MVATVSRTMGSAALICTLFVALSATTSQAQNNRQQQAAPPAQQAGSGSSIPGPTPPPPTARPGAPSSQPVREISERRHLAPYIADHSVQATVKSDGTVAVVTTLVIQNDGGRDAEYELIFPASSLAVLDSFQLLGADKKPIAAKAYPADKAQAIFEEIVRRRRDPALLKYAGSALFHARIFPIPARGKATLRLKYSEVLEVGRGNMFAFRYPLAPRSVTIDTAFLPGSVYSPTHKFELTQTSGKARLTWTKPKKTSEQTPDEVVAFIATASDQAVDARVICYHAPGAKDGYFLLTLSPNLAAAGEEAGKNIVVVLDRSGSMAGKKIEQAKDALKYVLSSLNAKDLFNVIAYNDVLTPFQPAMVEYTSETRDRALAFADGLEAQSGTNIHDALQSALKQMPQNGRTNMVVFLTDGLPTAGPVRAPAEIRKAIKGANATRTRIAVFGVGYDVDSKFLDRLAVENHGIADFVAPEENIEQKVSEFYASIRHPALSDLKLEIASTMAVAQLDVTDLYPQVLPDLFRGRSFVVVGRYQATKLPESASPNVRAGITLTGSIAGKPQRFHYHTDFAATGTDSDADYAFVARLWATRRIGYLIDEIRLHGSSDELVKEIVRLGTEFGVITEYTSFLLNEDAVFGATAENLRRAGDELAERAKESRGSHGFAQAANTKQMQRNAQVKQGYAWRDADGKTAAGARVLHIGNKVFYRRGGHWIDARCSAGDRKAEETIERYSARFFELARASRANKHYLALPEGEITIELAGKVYRVIPEVPKEDNKPNK